MAEIDSKKLDSKPGLIPRLDNSQAAENSQKIALLGNCARLSGEFDPLIDSPTPIYRFNSVSSMSSTRR